MGEACACTGAAWLWIESPQGIARRNGIKSVHQGRRSSSVSSQSELTKCVPLEHWRDSFPSHLQESPKLSQMPCRCGFWEGSHPNFGNSGRPYTHRQYLLRVEMTVSQKVRRSGRNIFFLNSVKQAKIVAVISSACSTFSDDCPFPTHSRDSWS
jgi:hypothetical protein